MTIELKTSTLNGKAIAYSSETEFLIQLGKGKSSYKTKHKIVGNLAQAVLIYNGYNVHSGYKKRLISYNLNKPVLDRYISN